MAAFLPFIYLQFSLLVLSANPFSSLQAYNNRERRGKVQCGVAVS
jgi:hypothetical protein